MNHSARKVFLSGALAITIASAAASAYGGEIYVTHADLYASIKATPTGAAKPGLHRKPRLREGSRAAIDVSRPPKPKPVPLSDAPNGRLTTDTL